MGVCGGRHRMSGGERQLCVCGGRDEIVCLSVCVKMGV